MDTSRDSSNLLDTHNRLIADVLSRFRMLTMLATIQAEGERKNVEPQTVAVTGMSMQMEFEGLISFTLRPQSQQTIGLRSRSTSADFTLQHTSVKDLLALSRRLKELWLFGKLGQGERDARIQADELQADVVRCAELLNAIQEKRYAGLAAEAGGSWAPIGRQDAAAAAPAAVEGAAAGPQAAGGIGGAGAS
ncbi:cell cycle control protein [Colletotrichum plurivorum]|uniref:Cell cycle control protein n=1 Tax=Colletotrichum plurivorum TaxID=2175906 RepID=A0A8H6K262_9PEZI|nr:cell cycle control protein [Colletotrichum plurivorum]